MCLIKSTRDLIYTVPYLKNKIKFTKERSSFCLKYYFQAEINTVDWLMESRLEPFDELIILYKSKHISLEIHVVTQYFPLACFTLTVGWKW